MAAAPLMVVFAMEERVQVVIGPRFRPELDQSPAVTSALHCERCQPLSPSSLQRVPFDDHTARRCQRTLHSCLTHTPTMSDHVSPDPSSALEARVDAFSESARDVRIHISIQASTANRIRGRNQNLLLRRRHRWLRGLQNFLRQSHCPGSPGLCWFFQPVHRRVLITHGQ